MPDTNQQVLVVLSHFRRPENLWPILKAVMGQTVKPTKIAIVDNSGMIDTPSLPPDSLRHRVEVWSFPDPGGPTARWIPALMELDCRYTLFLDDDLLPGPRAIEHCLATAATLGDRFSTIGQIGRMLTGPEGAEYVKRNVGLWDGKPRPVDMTCRGHFVKTSVVRTALFFREALQVLAKGSPEEISNKAATVHDDLFLSLGRQWPSGATATPCYLLPQAPPEFMIRMKDLPDGGVGVSKRPEHRDERNKIVRACKSIGWESLAGV